MAAWPTDETSSDSDGEDEVSVIKTGNGAHSSYDYWYQYYQTRKQNNMKQKMNSNQRSYHKYQRNFISSKTGNVSNYHSSCKNNQRNSNNYKTPPLMSKKNIIKHSFIKHHPQTSGSLYKNKDINKNATNMNLNKLNKFNTHIVPTSVDTSNSYKLKVNVNANLNDKDVDTISPFLRVQRNKKKMPYNYSNVSLASLASIIVNTPSDSSTKNDSNALQQQLEQLQREQFLKQRTYKMELNQFDSINNVVSDCMKATQCSALSSLMFTTPQKFTYFQQHRHLYFHHEEFTKQRELFVKQWRAKECDKRAMRTEGIIIALCLNIGIDPPDIVRTNPCSVYECWMNPTELPASRAMEVIANRLKQQYSAWKGKQRKLNIQKILDGNPEQVRQTCLHLRQYATDRRVIFHYNGHGVPRPTDHGELWFFNSNFSEYLPVSILDVAQWLQTPSMIVLDCSCAGKIVSSFKQYEPILKQQRLLKRQNSHKDKHAAHNYDDLSDTDSLYRFSTMILAACDENEILPMNPEYPNDIFTSCLTSPIKMALKWFISTQLMDDDGHDTYENTKSSADNSKHAGDSDIKEKDKKDDDYKHKFNKDNDNKYMALLDMIFDPKIGGLPSDKKNILGELHWIFLSVTDTIAWNVLPNKLFQNLFRLDYTIQALFRNYLLAERIMKSMNRNPVSYPSLPSTNNHPMWQSWDSAVDAALLQLKQYVNVQNQWKYRKYQQSLKQADTDKDENEHKHQMQDTEDDKEPKLKWKDSSFFQQQLRAFEVWIETGEIQKKPYHLPIVLQAVLNKQFRLKALTLLSRYLDLGPWTVNYVLWVGLHSYFKLLLKQCIHDDGKTLRYSLTFIWAKILAHDPSCRHDLISSKHYVFFYKELKRKDNSDQQIFLSTFILAQIASKQPTGQKVLLSKACGGHKKGSKYSLLNILKNNIFHPNNNIKIWSILCIAKIWQNLDEIKAIAYDITDCLILQLSSICIQVRAVTMYALGTFFNLRDITSPKADQPLLGPQLDLTLGHQLTKLVHDPSPIIRMELVFVLSSLIYYQQEQFRDYYNKQKMYKKEQRRRIKEEQLNAKSLSTQKHSIQAQLSTRKKSGGFFSKSLQKNSGTHHKSSAAEAIANKPSSGYMPATEPSLQTTHSMPPEKRPQFQHHRGTKSATPYSTACAAVAVEQLSPMIAPTNTLNDEEKEIAKGEKGIRTKDEEYEQRKRIWEVIKVLCKDPIAEISRNANKVKHYMTSDKVKSQRSRALSDPEKHAKLVLDPMTPKSIASLTPKSAVMFQPTVEKEPKHTKSNTIFGALTDTLSNIKKDKKHHRKVASQHISPHMVPTHTSATPSRKNMKGKSAFFVDDNDDDYNKGKKDDPLWNIPDSPLFSWLTEHISRPLTNAMYDAPDPLYHELDPKNLPLIDPRLTMSNFFYHQEQQKYDQEQKLLAKNFKIETNPNNQSLENSIEPMKPQERASISEYFLTNNSFKLRYNEMNATLALNYIRLAAIRSWEIRKFYMLEQRAKAQWKNLLRIVDPDTYSVVSDNKHLQVSNRHSPQISKSVASSPNHLRSATEQSLASSSFTLPSGMIHDDKPRLRSLSSDFSQPNYQNMPKSTTTTKKKKILSFLGANKSKNKDDTEQKNSNANSGSAYDLTQYLSPKKGKKKKGQAPNSDSMSRSLDTAILIPNTDNDAHVYDKGKSGAYSPLSTTSGPAGPSSPFISPYDHAVNVNTSNNIDVAHSSNSSYIYYHLYNDTNSVTSPMNKESASKFIKTGMRINNQIERYDTDCDGGITAIKFHPFRNILYCADSAGRVWVWKYEANIGGNNPNTKRRLNRVNIKDTHLSNAVPLLRSTSASLSTPAAGFGAVGGLNSLAHSRSVGNFSDIYNTTIGNNNEYTNNEHPVVITSFEIINKYHDTMLLCAGDDGTIRIYRNSHLENSMSAVTAFLANARIKPTRNQSITGSHGKMITSWCSEFGYLYSGGSHNTVKIHDCHNEAYFGSFYTKCNTTSILGGDNNYHNNSKNILIAGCIDNKMRMFDLRTNLNTNSNTKEMPILFSSPSTAKILSIKPTHKESSNCYYICSTQELLLYDLRNQSVITRIPFKKYINTFDSHQFAPIYALGSTKQFVQICSSIKLDSNIKLRSKLSRNGHKQKEQAMQSVNEICYHDGFLGARIGPVRTLKFHPYKLLLAVGGTNKHLSLYSSSNLKNNSLL